jgi:hypothetical protein
MAEVDETAPETLTLWQCVGCGAMGNAKECVAACDFRRYFVVNAASHADLLEYWLSLSEYIEALRGLAREIVAEAETPERFERALERLRLRARDLLAQAPPEQAPPAVPPDERAEIWLCAACGVVEAPRDCLGICVRRTGDFVGAADHDALSARIEMARLEARSLAALARQTGWTVARPGQAGRMRAALRNMATISSDWRPQELAPGGR